MAVRQRVMRELLEIQRLDWFSSERRLNTTIGIDLAGTLT
jgi:hypothetical protein